ncbi:MAG: helicase-related protein, partial [Promethearchaeota archaeon]
EKIDTKKGVGVVNSESFLMQHGRISYEVLFENGKKEQINEYEIYSSYASPVEALFNRQVPDPPQNFLIKYWSNLFYSYYTSYQIKCITNSRLTLMPHQINVAHRLSEEYFPRVILADEVGLGKTIEAGIYIKEMMARNLVERILIIVPATLVKQWQFEMSNKFNIQFTIYDSKKIKEIKRSKYVDLQNPFYYDNLIICSLQFARNRKYIELLSQISWDIAIFDEAHHLRRYLTNATTGNYRETLNFELARKISQDCESLLLLSATPLQLHSFELYSLIELIHPEAFDNFSEFEHFRKDMPFINLLVVNVNQIDNLNRFELENTIKLLRNLRYVNPKDSENDVLKKLKGDSFKMDLLTKVERDHTLSRFLIRNRKKNVFSEDLMNKRIVNTIMVKPKKQELEIYNKIRLYLAKIYNSSIHKENIGLGFIITTLQKLLTSSKYAILKSLERRLEQIERSKNLASDVSFIKEYDPDFFELELEEDELETEQSGTNGKRIKNTSSKMESNLLNQEQMIKDFYNELKTLPYDSKSDKLLDLIKKIYSQNPKEKILIFTQFVDTLFFIKSLLEKEFQKIHVEAFYGKINKEEKDEAVERFRNSEDFSILLSTEIGGEGRNFQFCRIMVNYDLPWNPMKLEQRIGRLDRIGQESKEIYIYNFFLEDTVETDIIFALNKRIDLFEQSVGVLEPIIGKIERDFKNLIFSEPEVKQRKLREFNYNLDLEIKKAKEIEMQLDDLMIDKRSFQMEGLITSLASCHDVKLGHNELYLLMQSFFNLEEGKYGSLQTIPHDGDQINLNIQFLKYLESLLADEYKGTFNIKIAQEREEIDFFALGHPLINEILNYCRSSQFQGSYSILNVKKSVLKELSSLSVDKSELYMFIFTIKFQGFIVENQLIAIIVDDSGNEVKFMENYITNIENFKSLYDFNSINMRKSHLSQSFLKRIKEKAKSHVKYTTSYWKKDIKDLNNKIFNLEMKKKEKIYEHKKRILHIRIEALKDKLQRKNNQKPTQQVLKNIQNLDDEKRREARLEKIRQLEEEIRFIEKDIKHNEKNIDDLSFEYEDLKNEMLKRNIGKYYTNLLSYAIIMFVD